MAQELRTPTLQYTDLNFALKKDNKEDSNYVHIPDPGLKALVALNNLGLFSRSNFNCNWREWSVASTEHQFWWSFYILRMHIKMNLDQAVGNQKWDIRPGVFLTCSLTFKRSLKGYPFSTCLNEAIKISSLQSPSHTKHLYKWTWLKGKSLDNYVTNVSKLQR